MSERLEELTPIAPRKTKRRDGWSYWAGVNLWAEGTNGLPDAAAAAVERGLLPTPCVNDDNKSVQAHMRMKQTKMPGGPRSAITCSEVIARNEFRQANGSFGPPPPPPAIGRIQERVAMGEDS